MLSFSSQIASKLSINEGHAKAVLALLEEGASIPFIARYRKDQTGALDEVQIQQIQAEAAFLKEFSARKEFIEKTIAEQGKMTEEIGEMLGKAVTLSELEDIYLPFKPKRKTRAQAARENGLEPLALSILKQDNEDPEALASSFFSEQVPDVGSVLKGALYIISEMVNEDASVRGKLRTLFEREARIVSKVITGKEEEGAKYKDYFDFSEAIAKIPSHRTLALFRGFLEGFLRVSIQPEEEDAIRIIEEAYLRSENRSGELVKKAILDAYKRLLHPSLESEFRGLLKAKADQDAIDVFADNLRQLLLSSPLGNKRILAIDPGYRTGCKVVVLDQNGELLQTDLIYVHEKNHRMEQASRTVEQLVQEFNVECFAVGDGTAGRETQQFLKGLGLSLPIFLVNEDGASVYSASEVAREEFPDQDITVRGAVSIGRRLMDPLAELVKIDPKSIGVGQYQHDVNPVALKERLDKTVESCVNAVGVNLNSSGKHLLQYVSGIGATLAENIVNHRRANGPFKTRQDLLQVERLGPKAFEQCAGFLRIKGGAHPLDESGVHPEAYPIVEKMAADLGVPLEQLIKNSELVDSINIKDYATEKVGVLAVEDIIKELKKPGLDPRAEMESFEFADVFQLEDLHVGMVLPGVVTNLTRFGAFVDVGVKQDGLVHVSEIAHRYISDPSQALKLNQKVQVKVLELDIPRKRISLSIKQTEEPPASSKKQRMKQNKKTGASNFQDALASLKNKFS